MKSSTASQMRAWTGPAILSFGFRPLFLLAALWAMIAMVLWIGMLAGLVSLPTAFDPVTWHTHEFLFGYLSAVIAGFLLTAVPNWTGRLPVVGWSLAWLAALWVIGRIAIATSLYLPALGVALADLAFLCVLWGVVLREIIAGKNWRNLPVLILVGMLVVANITFHIEAASGSASHGYGLRFGLALSIILISLIGGKIIPSFTRNWLVKQGATDLPTPPMQRFDKATLVVTVLALLAWALAPMQPLAGAALLIMGGLHLMRMMRWQGVQTSADSLVWVLHIAYLCVPLGAICVALSILAPSIIGQALALHIWTAGAIGLMTVAVMTRASLGHSGRALVGGRSTTFIYLALIGAVVLRVLADVVFVIRIPLLDASALLWILGFAGFVGIYGPMLLSAKIEKTA